MFSKDTLHHAYFIEGERQAVLADIEVFLKDAFSIVREGHPDVHYAEYESFGIDESRGLQDMQSLRPLVGDKKIFIIATDAFTGEAQNALLKVFEEPTPGTHFFIISSSERILLPTLRSRMVVMSHSSVHKTQDTSAKKFITSGYKDRLTYVADIIESKDRALAELFIQSLIIELGACRDTKELLTYARYMKDRASSLKLILERIALLDLKA